MEILEDRDLIINRDKHGEKNRNKESDFFLS